MKPILKQTIYLLLSFLVVSCGPSQREMAVQQINKAKQSIVSGDTLVAIAQLDSVKIFFPKANVQLVVAKNMTAELYRQLIDRSKDKLNKNDSLIASLELKFIKQKTEFDQYTQYIPKRQSLDRSWDRSFLQVNLDERGELYLTSNYMGKDWLEHTAIRIYDGKLQAKSGTVELDDPMNYRSQFLDYKWEKVAYLNGKSDSVIHFIVEHPNLDLKCVFLGTRYYYILLEEYDIQAVTEALALSNAIKRRKIIAEEIKNFQQKISLLQ
ncbi:MAG: hypothetical protein ACERKD_13215 [Prolixibacteraceae bacterium]